MRTLWGEDGDRCVTRASPACHPGAGCRATEVLVYRSRDCENDATRRAHDGLQELSAVVSAPAPVLTERRLVPQVVAR